MAIYRNVSNQKIAVFAWDTAANAEKTGDAANITARISKDGAAVAQTNDVNPTELDVTYMPGVYLFDMTQAETNADLITLFAKSGTANIKLEPVIIYTLPTWAASQIAQTGDAFTRLGAPAGASVSADLAAIYAAIDTEIATLLTNVATILAAVDTEVVAIKAKTDNLPVDPADASDIAASFASLTGTLATIAGYIDTEVAIIKGVTDKLDTTLEVDGLVYRFTANALEEAPSGGGGSGITNFVYGGDWIPSQQNRIAFYLQDTAGVAITGLGSSFVLTLAKNGGAFTASSGTKAEIGSGWYTYLSTAGEADTVGTLAVKVTGAGAVEQKLEYTVKQRTSAAIPFTYTVTNSVTFLPVQGVVVRITTDLAGLNTIWVGSTSMLGVARDGSGGLPYLDPGVYYFFKQLAGYSDDQNPDIEIVS